MCSRLWLLLGVVLCFGCTPEPPATDDCRCFFASRHLSVRCGTTCVGGDLLTCSSTEVAEQPGACAVDAGSPDAGTRDAGLLDGGPSDGGTTRAMDASVEFPVDGGVDEPFCQPVRDDCRCRIRLSSQITYIVPCCASLCFESQDWSGWRCTPSGTVERVSSCQ